MITARNLTKRFGRLVALNSINLEIDEVPTAVENQRSSTSVPACTGRAGEKSKCWEKTRGATMD